MIFNGSSILYRTYMLNMLMILCCPCLEDWNTVDLEVRVKLFSHSPKSLEIESMSILVSDETGHPLTWDILLTIVNISCQMSHHIVTSHCHISVFFCLVLVRLSMERSTRIVTASNDRTASVWDIASGEMTTTLKHDLEVNSAAFDPSGSVVVTASQDQSAKLWDPESAQVRLKWLSPKHPKPR